MSTKKIVLRVIVGIVLTLLLAGGIYFLATGQKKDENENYIVHSADWENVEKIEVGYTEKFTLVKSGSDWIMEGYDGIGVNKTFVETLVKSMCDIVSPMIIEDAEDNECGLDKAAAYVDITFQNGSEKILVGNPSGEFYYVKRAGNGTIYLVDKADLYMMMLEKIKYLDNSAIKLESDVVGIMYNDIILTKTGTSGVGDGWVIEKPYTYAANATKITEFITEKIKSVEAENIESKNDIAVENGTDVMLTLSDGNTFSFTAYGNGYIAIGNEDVIYKVKDDVLAFLSFTPFELVLNYAAPIAITEVKKLSFVYPDGKAEFVIENPDGDVPVFYKDGEKIGEEAFRAFYQRMMMLAFSGEGETIGEAEYKITFTKVNDDVYEMEFVPFSESEFAVRINQKTDFIINKKSVTDVFELLKQIAAVN